jgi:putative ABC transport system permease protein
MHEWREEIERRMAGSGLPASEEAEVVEELAQHLEDRYEELMARGAGEPEARAAALAELESGAETLASAVSGVRGVGSPTQPPPGATAAGGISGLVGDVRYAVRSLRRSPGYAAAVLVTLALGIGAASAVHAVVHPLLLRPLPFPDPERLVTLDVALIPGEYGLIREHVTSFDIAALYRPGAAFGLSGDGEAERVVGAETTPELFSTVGVGPVAGALPDAVEAGAGEMAVLSYGLWQRRFGGDPGVVGRAITLEGRPVPVVAVMPPGFSYPGRSELWLAAPLDRANAAGLWGTGGYRIVARLRPDAPAARAEAEIRALSSAMSDANPFWTPRADYRSDVRMISLTEATVGEVRRALWLLGAAVSLLLLIACGNVGNLILARGLGRVRELAVRTALGADRGRIVRQLLTETMVLVTAGGVLGIALALLAVRSIRGILPPDLPRSGEVGLDIGVLALAVVVTLVTGVLLGVLPARRATRFDLHHSLRDGGRATGDRSGRRLSSGLVVGQVALAVVLATGAGLVGRSLLSLHRVDTGIDRMEVVTARIDLPAAHYAQAARRNAFHDELVARLAALPGIHSVATTSQLPFSGHLQIGAMAVEHVTTDPNNLPVFIYRRVTPGFFEAVGIPLRQGRPFSSADGEPGALPVAIVDETAAREFWPGEDPIGKRLGRPWMNEQLVVVGVVGSVLDGNLAGEPERTVYMPLAVDPPHNAFVVLSGAGTGGAAALLRSVVRQIDPSVPVSEIATVRSLVGGSLGGQRLSAALLASFGLLALILAAIGIYGVLAYAVAQRGRELALRRALGATGGDLVGIVLGHGLRLTAAGLFLGLGATVAFGRVLAGMLHGVEPRDPATLALVTATVLAAAILAATLPALRAGRAEPMQAMRE